jgi:aspartate/methionine/tyrosine aminotransferase
MIVPPTLIDVMNRLGQNLYINAPTLSQLAACHAFDPECSIELEGHVTRYAVNRQVVLETLKDLELDKGASPADGAFYVYVDLSVSFMESRIYGQLTSYIYLFFRLFFYNKTY